MAVQCLSLPHTASLTSWQALLLVKSLISLLHTTQPLIVSSRKADLRRSLSTTYYHLVSYSKWSTSFFLNCWDEAKTSARKIVLRQVSQHSLGSENGVVNQQYCGHVCTGLSRKLRVPDGPHMAPSQSEIHDCLPKLVETDRAPQFQMKIEYRS